MKAIKKTLKRISVSTMRTGRSSPTSAPPSLSSSTQSVSSLSSLPIPENPFTTVPRHLDTSTSSHPSLGNDSTLTASFRTASSHLHRSSTATALTQSTSSTLHQSNPPRSSSLGQRDTLSAHKVHSRIQLQAMLRFISAVTAAQPGLHPITSLTELRTGLHLLALVKALSKHEFPLHKEPVGQEECVYNVGLVLEYLGELGIPLSEGLVIDVVRGNVKKTLGLCFVIVLHFYFHPLIRTKPKLDKVDLATFQHSVHQLNVFPNKEGRVNPAFYLVLASAEKALLQWSNQLLSKYLPDGTKDFRELWCSGLPFLALLHHISPELVDWEVVRLQVTKDQWVGNLDMAFRLAEQKLNIPRLLEAEETALHTESTSVMLYVCLFYHFITRQERHRTALSDVNGGTLTTAVRKKKSKKKVYASERERELAHIRKRSQRMELMVEERDQRMREEESCRIFRRGKPFPIVTLHSLNPNEFLEEAAKENLAAIVMPEDGLVKRSPLLEKSEEVVKKEIKTSPIETKPISLPPTETIKLFNSPLSGALAEMGTPHPFNTTENLSANSNNDKQSDIVPQTSIEEKATAPEKEVRVEPLSSPEIESRPPPVRSIDTNRISRLSITSEELKELGIDMSPQDAKALSASTASLSSQDDVDAWFRHAEKVEHRIVTFSNNIPTHKRVLENESIFKKLCEEALDFKSKEWIPFVETTFGVLFKYNLAPSSDPANPSPISATPDQESAVVIKLTFATIENKWNGLLHQVREGETRLHLKKEEMDSLNELQRLRHRVRDQEAVFPSLDRSEVDTAVVVQLSAEIADIQSELSTFHRRYTNVAQLTSVTNEMGSLQNLLLSLQRALQQKKDDVQMRDTATQFTREADDVRARLQSLVEGSQELPFDSVAATLEEMEDDEDEHMEALEAQVQDLVAKYKEFVERARNVRSSSLDSFATRAKENTSLPQKLVADTLAELQTTWKAVESLLSDVADRVQTFQTLCDHFVSLQFLKEQVMQVHRGESRAGSVSAEIQRALDQLPKSMPSAGEMRQRLEALLATLTANEYTKLLASKQAAFEALETQDYWLMEMEADLEVETQNTMDSLEAVYDFQPLETFVSSLEDLLEQQNGEQKKAVQKIDHLLSAIDAWTGDKTTKSQLAEATQQKKEGFEKRLEKVVHMITIFRKILTQTHAIVSFGQLSDIYRGIFLEMQSSQRSEANLQQSMTRLKDMTSQLEKMACSLQESPLLKTAARDASVVVESSDKIRSLIGVRTKTLVQTMNELGQKLQVELGIVRGQKIVQGIVNQANDIEKWVQTKINIVRFLRDTVNVPIDEVLERKGEIDSIQSDVTTYQSAVSHFEAQIERFLADLNAEQQALLCARREQVQALWKKLQEAIDACAAIHDRYIESFNGQDDDGHVDAIMQWKKPIDTLSDLDKRSLRSFQSAYSTRSMIPVPSSRLSRSAHRTTATRPRSRSRSRASRIPGPLATSRLGRINEADRAPTPDYSGYGAFPHLSHKEHFKPDKSSSLDVSIANLINAWPYAIQVRKDDDEVMLSTSNRSSMVSKGGEVKGRYYYFGEIDPRKYFCKLLSNGTVMVRVGGGYEQLEEFLQNRTKLVKGIPRLNSFQ